MNLLLNPRNRAVFFFNYKFLMWTIFKVFIEFVKVLLLFYVWCFCQKACGILAPLLGIKPTALDGESLITELPGKSQSRTL